MCVCVCVCDYAHGVESEKGAARAVHKMTSAAREDLGEITNLLNVALTQEP